MRYRYFDGFEFEANNNHEIAVALWKSKFIPEATLEEWMESFARRLKMWDGTDLDISSVDAMAAHLLRSGHLTKLE